MSIFLTYVHHMSFCSTQIRLIDMSTWNDIVFLCLLTLVSADLSGNRGHHQPRLRHGQCRAVSPWLLKKMSQAPRRIFLQRHTLKQFACGTSTGSLTGTFLHSCVGTWTHFSSWVTCGTSVQASRWTDWHLWRGTCLGVWTATLLHAPLSASQTDL